LFFREGPMDCKRKPGIRGRVLRFRGITWVLSVCIAGVLALTWGCSGGEDKPPEGKNKVVVAIKKPKPEAAPEKQAEPAPVAPQKPAGLVIVPKKEAEASPEQSSAEKQAPTTQESAAPAKPAPAAPQAEAPSPQKTEALNVEKPEASEGEKPEASKAEKPEVPKLKKGFVRVGKGESLSAVAARKDVYGDPLKWPRLYRLNLEHLGMIRTWKDVEKESLPEGMSLRYARQEEEKSAEPPLEGKPWVITIQSLQSPGGLAAPAIKLVQNGYLTYITRAVVKGTHWLRLRVGFYGSKAEAMAAKKKILKILGKDDSWVARAGKSELEEYGDR
jgi:hypothetical protein